MTQEPNWDELIARVHPKYRPIWEGISRKDRIALAKYYLRWRSKKNVLFLDRPKVAKFYGPFACQTRFPSGHRLCINTCTGCDHGCVYCYAAGYSPQRAKEKSEFEKGLLRDMADLESFGVTDSAKPGKGTLKLLEVIDALNPRYHFFGHYHSAIDPMCYAESLQDLVRWYPQVSQICPDPARLRTTAVHINKLFDRGTGRLRKHVMGLMTTDAEHGFRFEFVRDDWLSSIDANSIWKVRSR